MLIGIAIVVLLVWLVGWFLISMAPYKNGED